MEPVAAAPSPLLPGGDGALAGGSVGNMDDEISHEAQNCGASICTVVQTALRQNRLLFAFQPVVCAATGETDYFECLLRMRDLRGRIIAGGEFIAPIEQLGLIGFIDDYVLELTVRELARHPGVKLGLNISGLTACIGPWLQSLVSVLQYRPDVARRLVVEITETAALSDIEESARFVDTLRRAGCRVALDDFGVGHTRCDISRRWRSIRSRSMVRLSETWRKVTRDAFFYGICSAR